VRWAAVRLGRATADSAVVVAGLAPGDRVVVAGAYRLDPTLRVRPWDGTLP
jgi:multidrug efflux pump subunit AcrA (membrane-fusion protein)